MGSMNLYWAGHTLDYRFSGCDIFGVLKVIYDKLTEKSRGFGFVTMSSAVEVEAAAQRYNGHVCLSQFV